MSKGGPSYRILEKIGEGGMGVIYRAEDTLLHREVAIKVLRIDPERNLSPEKIQEIRERFRKEARAAAGLSHPNIVAVYQVGKRGDQDFIVMEYLEGRNLMEIMEDEATPLSHILRTVMQICDGLEYAHQKGVVHRDVKPDNIVVGREGRAKLMDFGIARIENPDLMKTQAGTLLGSPAFCAPEQLRDFRHVDGRADIFSVGVILYRWITGMLPFAAQDPTSVITQILTSEPVPPTILNPRIPPSLEKVVLKALAKEPHERFQSAGDLAGALSEILHEIEGPPAKGRGGRRGKGRWVGAHRSLGLAVSAVLFVALILYGVIAWRGERGLLEKDATLRGNNMAKMLEVVGVDNASADSTKILKGYLQAMGREREIVFLEVTSGNLTLAKFTDPQKILKERDIYVRGFPLRLKRGGSGLMIVGFSKAAYNARASRILTILVAGGVAILLLAGSVIFWDVVWKKRKGGS